MFRFFENLINPYQETLQSPPEKGFLAFIWSCTRGVRRFIVAMMLLTASIGVFEALLFAFMGKIVDWLSLVEPSLLWQQEKSSLFLLLVVILLSPVLAALQSLFKHQTLAGNFPMSLRWKFHLLMLEQSMSFYQDEFAGRVATKVLQTSMAVSNVCMILCDILVFAVIYFVTMVLIVGGFDAWIFLPFLGWIAAYLLTLQYFVPRLGKVGRKQADARSLMTGRITDAYTNISTVKLFSHAGREAAYAQSAMQSFMKTVHEQQRLVTGFEIVNTILSVLLLTATTGVALWLWIHEQIGVGAVAAAAAMALRLNGISHWIMWEMASLFEQVGIVQDGINTLTTPNTIKDHPDAKPLQVKGGSITFENVSFSYNRQQDVIKNLNLHIKPGEKVGLVGRSGAGKSTLSNLLLRFYEAQQGRVLIDGQDITHVTQDSLRASIGMVTQDTSLLHRSIRDNILYGRPRATEEELLQAALRAEAHDFIMELGDSRGRKGYDAHVGERGIKLSGGQRQRIAIARVMLKNAPVLLLDEATSALDSEIELAIQSSLYRLMEGKTVIAIAHRLSTIAAMDRLIVLDQGKITEAGTHQELLRNNGIYARLWAHQSGGFLGKDDVSDYSGKRS
ncbi:MAG: ABC transporter ATP-binding protein [Alcaligenaceae bacterium]|nr:ABC transporter ATP-binding protein [Alcaligenaceae bacterium]